MPARMQGDNCSFHSKNTIVIPLPSFSLGTWSPRPLGLVDIPLFKVSHCPPFQYVPDGGLRYIKRPADGSSTQCGVLPSIDQHIQALSLTDCSGGRRPRHLTTASARQHVQSDLERHNATKHITRALAVFFKNTFLGGEPKLMDMERAKTYEP